ncbi:helix-turn-helix domain-containing protein [Maribacter sp. 2307ULW6-5]|uniref:AraC family transcriptional regulator n=1 Tax=Maribacter sp. 2307ULW6-5 TaxID=3386275 RepID=UPI0039BD8278
MKTSFFRVLDVDMKLSLIYNVEALLGKVVDDLMKKSGISYELKGTSTLILQKPLRLSEKLALENELAPYGLQLVNSHTKSLVDNIKTEVNAYLSKENAADSGTLSEHLAQTLGYSYAHLSQTFRNNNHSTIEHFVILKRIDLAKKFMVSGKYNLTEIAYRLGFSNVSHLSRQFKKETGLTPSQFMRILETRMMASQG